MLIRILLCTKSFNIIRLIAVKSNKKPYKPQLAGFSISVSRAEAIAYRPWRSAADASSPPADASTPRNEAGT